MVADAIVRLKTPVLEEVEGNIAGADEDGLLGILEPQPDPMQSWIDECNQAADDMDARRWLIGDRASQVVTKYGEDRLGYFAAQIHLSKKTVYEYEEMDEFYTDERQRYTFLEESPTVRYTHMRIAKAKAKKANGFLAPTDQAYAYLDKAAIRAWTPDQFGKILTRAFRIYGDGKRQPKPIVKDAPCGIKSFDEMNSVVCIQVGDAKAYAKLLKASNEGKAGALLLTLK